MRTEEQVRLERERLLKRAERYRQQGRPDAQADMESDADLLTWVLGEEQ